MLGNAPLADNDQTWLIQTWHIIGGTPRPTSEITLPKQTAPFAPRPVTRADSAASTPV